MRGVGAPGESTIRFEEPARGIETLVRFEELELNVDVPPGAFTQRPRPGLTVERVACDPGE